MIDMNCEVCDRRPGTHYMNYADMIFYANWTILNMPKKQANKTKKQIMSRKVWICGKCPYSCSSVIEFFEKMVK